MKDFLERHIILVSGIALGFFILSTILGILLYGARELQLETLKRFDQPATMIVEGKELPGPKNMISDRSKYQVDTMFQETPHILGGWVTKLNYEKTEDPVIHYWTNVSVIEEIIHTYHEMQVTGHGYSSAELNASSEQSLRNSEEAKTGLIKCGPLSGTNLPKIAPNITKIAQGICRATIPPFDEKVNLAIVAVIDVPTNDVNEPDIAAIRRVLLQLQIDIFNRDYQGRETWARDGK